MVHHRLSVYNDINSVVSWMCLYYQLKHSSFVHFLLSFIYPRTLTFPRFLTREGLDMRLGLSTLQAHNPHAVYKIHILV